MAEDTHISWADDTFNPWIGCMKVGPACDGCYAEALMGMGGRMQRVEWGAPGVGVGTRVRTAPSNWAKPLKWDRERAQAIHRAVVTGAAIPPPRFVFCASLADVFDNAVPMEWRRDLFDLIRKTPNLTYLLLTKRPQNIARLFADTLTGVNDGDLSQLGRSRWPKNAAIGCTVVTQAEADRDIPHLLLAKAGLHPAFAFLSMEPLIEAVDLTRVNTLRFRGAEVLNALTGALSGMFDEPGAAALPSLDWVITGGETDQGDHKARHTHPAWLRSLRDQCAAAGVPYHHKQNGEWANPDVWDPTGNAVVRSSDVMVWPDGHVGGGVHTERGGFGSLQRRLGKKNTGRLIDGALHDARPTP